MSLGIYNEIHPMVSKDRVFITRWREFFSEGYPPEVRHRIRGGRCLDAGCGGTLKGIELIKELSPERVWACDINQLHGTINQKQARTGFVCTDLARLGFRDSQFDFILCNGVIHHMPDPWHAVGELARISKPGGIVHIGVYCFRNSLAHLLVSILRALSALLPFRWARRIGGDSLIAGILLDHAYVPHEHVFTRTSFLDGLSKCGFNIISVMDVAESYRHDPSVGFMVKHRRLLFGDGAILSFIGRKVS